MTGRSNRPQGVEVGDVEGLAEGEAGADADPDPDPDADPEAEADPAGLLELPAGPVLGGPLTGSVPAPAEPEVPGAGGDADPLGDPVPLPLDTAVEAAPGGAYLAITSASRRSYPLNRAWIWSKDSPCTCPANPWISRQSASTSAVSAALGAPGRLSTSCTANAWVTQARQS